MLIVGADLDVDRLGRLLRGERKGQGKNKGEHSSESTRKHVEVLSCPTRLPRFIYGGTSPWMSFALRRAIHWSLQGSCAMSLTQQIARCHTVSPSRSSRAWRRQAPSQIADIFRDGSPWGLPARRVWELEVSHVSPSCTAQQQTDKAQRRLRQHRLEPRISTPFHVRFYADRFASRTRRVFIPSGQRRLCLRQVKETATHLVIYKQFDVK